MSNGGKALIPALWDPVQAEAVDPAYISGRLIEAETTPAAETKESNHGYPRLPSDGILDRKAPFPRCWQTLSKIQALQVKP
jgi:hypothetical protein